MRWKVYLKYKIQGDPGAGKFTLSIKMQGDPGAGKYTLNFRFKVNQRLDRLPSIYDTG